MRTFYQQLLTYFSLLICLTSCSFAPKYKQPALAIPPHYKEAGKWLKIKSPMTLTPKPWWTLFQDKTLNALEKKVTCNNQNLKIAFAQYEKARALAQAVRSEQYPTINGFGIAARQVNSTTAGNSQTLPEKLFNTFMLGSELNYEVDVWGRVKNSVIAGDRYATASEFDLAAMNISLHAALAENYFKLRGADEAERILDTTIIAYQKALFLTKQRHIGGIAPESDVDEAVTQLENARTLATETRLKRAKLEHAIAVLIGDAPGNFLIKPRYTQTRPVIMPPHLPSTLLQHRPDIVAAEQRVQAANATIGVARAAFFPTFNLIALLGFQSQKISQLFSAPSLFWSIGPPTVLTLIQPEMSVVLFDGFKLQANLKRAKANYFETVAAYRQTVLTAFQEVEDALVAIHRLQEEQRSQAASTHAAKRAWYQDRERYKGGIVTFLAVVITENQALQSELALISIRTRLQVSYVQLIKALGGCWQIIE